MNKALKVLGGVLGGGVLLLGGGVAFLALRSPAMRPASTEKIAATPARIERGRYLSHHVADCLGCHSDHIEERFARPIRPGTEGRGGTVFDENVGVPGVVCAQNITPDRATGIGAWTDGEVMRAFREGVSRDGHALFPMMPYEHYRAMSDEDARSVVAFLRTLPAISYAPPARRIDFPVNLFIKSAPKPLAGPVEAPDDSKDHRAYGKYMATLSGCIECHTPHDDRGQRLAGKEFAGGWALKGPWGTVVTPNITPHPRTYVGGATKEQFVGRFKSYASMTAQNAPVAAKGSNTVMPWLAYAGMTETDLGAIYDYLKTVPSIENVVVPFPDAVASARAATP